MSLLQQKFEKMSQNVIVQKVLRPNISWRYKLRHIAHQDIINELVTKLFRDETSDFRARRGETIDNRFAGLLLY